MEKIGNAVSKHQEDDEHMHWTRNDNCWMSSNFSCSGITVSEFVFKWKNKERAIVIKKVVTRPRQTPLLFVRSVVELYAPNFKLTALGFSHFLGSRPPESLAKS